MTAKELRRLAEIAGFSISKYYSDFYTKNISKRKEIAIMVKDWRPHLRIEQAMMVAEKFKRFIFYKHDYPTQNISIFGVRLMKDETFQGCTGHVTLAEAICRAALAAAKDG